MNTALLWFRRDLRLTDNPALAAALAAADHVIPVYIHDPAEAIGAASRWWQHHSLAALAGSLAERGSRLLIRQGDTRQVLAELARETGAQSIHWNRRYEPAQHALEDDISAWANAAGLTAHPQQGGLLVEPWAITTGKGTPYRVFTPFHKACLQLPPPPAPRAAPETLPPVGTQLKGLDLAQLDLLPTTPWDSGLREHWQVGEAAALDALDGFLDQGVALYDSERDRPDKAGTSRLSPRLHFGELSPRQVWWACRQVGEAAAPYLRQLYWREFAHHLLHHYPHTVDQPLDERFSHFPWRPDHVQTLQAWQQGRTGIPIVDAGMRELWHTGWMHNRVRMLVASLLTKNLLIPWQAGAAWFHDTLVDADLANNTLGWQWTAGCGADAAPYFRIFNPVLQSRKFDPAGLYLARWLPELARLPAKWRHAPWEASAQVLTAGGIATDSVYRSPLVDLTVSRRTALMIWDGLKTR